MFLDGNNRICPPCVCPLSTSEICSFPDILFIISGLWLINMRKPSSLQSANAKSKRSRSKPTSSTPSKQIFSLIQTQIQLLYYLKLSHYFLITKHLIHDIQFHNHYFPIQNIQELSLLAFVYLQRFSIKGHLFPLNHHQ